MQCFYIKVWYFWLFFWLIGNGLRSAPLNIPETIQCEDAQFITSWVAVGPFRGGTVQLSYSSDFLKVLGLSEQQLVQSSSNLDIDILRQSLAMLSAKVAIQREVTAIDLRKLLDIKAGDREAASVYLLCNIQSQKRHNSWLTINSDGLIKIWFNGDPVTRWRRGHQSTAGLVTLTEGYNKIVIKLTDLRLAKEIVALMSPENNHALGFNECSLLRMLKKHVVQQGEPVSSYLETIFRNDQPVFDIIDETGVVRIHATGEVEGSAWQAIQPGGYTVRMTVGATSLEEYLFVEGKEPLIEYFKRRSQRFLSDPAMGPTLAGLLMRMQTILDALSAGDVRFSMRPELDYKLAWVAHESQEIIIALEHGREPLKHVPGLHLRGIKSNIDDQNCYYRVFVPNRAGDDQSLPLVVIMTPSILKDVPFLESPIVAQQEEAEAWDRIAAKLGVCLLWPGYRNNPRACPLEFSHLDRIVKAVCDDYSIDKNRISLLGYSTAGLTASMAVIKNPRRYSALALIDPVLRITSIGDDVALSSESHNAFVQWQSATDPFTELTKMKGLAINVVHDKSVSHGPLKDTLEFVQLRKANRLQVEFKMFDRPLGKSQEQSMLAGQIAWLAKKDRADADFEMTEETVASAHSLAHCFAERFLVVLPTGSSPSGDRRQMDQLCRNFTEAWAALVHTACRTILDVEVSELDIQESNLVLVGNPWSNAVWKRMNARLPISVENDEISINGTHWNGDLSIQAWCKNPENPFRKVVLIGGTKNSAMWFPTLQLATDGWYDYGLWRGSGQEVIVGRFVDNR